MKVEGKTVKAILDSMSPKVKGEKGGNIRIEEKEFEEKRERWGSSVRLFFTSKRKEEEGKQEEWTQTPEKFVRNGI